MSQRLQGWDRLERNLRAIEGLVKSGEWAESLLVGADVIADHVRDNIRTTLYNTGALHDSVKAEIVNINTAAITVNRVYAAAHEYGLDRQPITARQRAFFWAKFSETGNPMWKALALSRTYTIPARPYVRPAIDNYADNAVDAIAVDFAGRIKGVVT